MEKHKPQIIFIHGGDAFETKKELYETLRAWEFDLYVPERISWQKTLFANFKDTHDCFRLSMPNSFWADYEAWKIWFEKAVPQFRDNITLIGNSLGGGFLLRYLTENVLPVTIKQLHLVAACVDDMDCANVGGFRIDMAKWSGFKKQISEVHLWHSEDDTIVPIHHSERFLALYPNAVPHRFTDRGHFLTESFPELEATIKSFL